MHQRRLGQDLTVTVEAADAPINHVCTINPQLERTP